MGSRFRAADWYEAPLYYDIVFDVGTRGEADFLEAVLARHGRTGTRPARVLEPACGTGRLLAELARRGHRVAGFDSAPAMAEFARLKLVQHGVRGRILDGRMESFRISGRFDLAFNLLSSFKHLLDEDSARAHLAAVADHLAPGGLYVLGIHLTDYHRVRPEHERWVGERDGIRVVCNTRTWPPDTRRRREAMRNRLTIEHPDPGHVERLETCWEARTYDLRQLKRTLDAVGDRLEPVAIHDFHHDIDTPRALDGTSPDPVVVLRRIP